MKTDPIVDQVIDKFKQRSELGIKKYGMTLAENDKDDFLNHLQEELMDAIVYIQKLKSPEQIKEENDFRIHILGIVRVLIGDGYLYALDREWFKTGDILYYKGLPTKITTIYTKDEHGLKFGTLYGFDRPVKLQVGDFLTIDK